MYHRVSETADYLGLCVPPAAFDAQLDLLSRRIRVIPLRTLVERLQRPKPLEEDVAAITFDDGYRDNLDIALPILQRHGLPATLFVTTGFLDGTAWPTGERLRGAFEVLWRQGVSAEAWRTEPSKLDRLVRATLRAPGSLAALRRLERQVKRAAPDEMEHLLSKIERLAGYPPKNRALMLDWHAVRALAAHGVEIASHTASHALLSHVSLACAERELRSSKEQIEAQISGGVVGFAFPNGHRNDFTTDHVALLRRIGYMYACTAETGVNRPGSDPFRLRRIGVGADSRALLDLKLAIVRGTEPCAA
ncbi:MAG: polysaccharide deacetylase family protein [Candidatus Binatia bacterium]